MTRARAATDLHSVSGKRDIHRAPALRQPADTIARGLHGSRTVEHREFVAESLLLPRGKVDEPTLALRAVLAFGQAVSRLHAAHVGSVAIILPLREVGLVRR